jgi:rSAM/selenodomain-associated transferase 2
MRAPLSIIIPTLNTAEALARSMPHLFEGLENGLIRELIVSDGGSTDGVDLIAEDLGAVLVRGKAGRGGQMVRGADAAKGDWLLFLHSDTWLDVGWSDVVMRHLQTQPDKAACFRLSFRAVGFGARFVAGWANLRTRLFGLPYGDQGMLVSRAHYDSVGGFQDIALMEDVALARLLRGQIVILPSCANTDAARFRRGGWFLRGARNIATLTLYFCGVSPDRLARYYNH